MGVVVNFHREARVERGACTSQAGSKHQTGGIRPTPERRRQGGEDTREAAAGGSGGGRGGGRAKQQGGPAREGRKQDGSGRVVSGRAHRMQRGVVCLDGRASGGMRGAVAGGRIREWGGCLRTPLQAGRGGRESRRKGQRCAVGAVGEGRGFEPDLSPAHGACLLQSRGRPSGGAAGLCNRTISAVGIRLELHTHGFFS